MLTHRANDLAMANETQRSLSLTKQTERALAVGNAAMATIQKELGPQDPLAATALNRMAVRSSRAVAKADVAVCPAMCLYLCDCLSVCCLID